MDSLLEGQKLEDELNAVKRHLQALSKQQLKLQNDYATLLQQRPRRVNPPQIPLADPPAPITINADSSVSQPVNINVKSLKPPLAFSLACPPTATIAELKQQLSESDSSAPAPDSQRWLYKGKALADNKLLKEYDSIKAGETVHLMVKPPTNSTPNVATPSSTIAEPGTPMPSFQATSPLPASTRPPQPKLAMSIPKITMDVEGTEPPEQPFISRSRSGSVNTNPAHSPHLGISESFRSVVTKDEFWVELKNFLGIQFGPYGPGEENARQMWEHLFNSSKEWMTASEIAKIREAAGISGMAGR